MLVTVTVTVIVTRDRDHDRDLGDGARGFGEKWGQTPVGGAIQNSYMGSPLILRGGSICAKLRAVLRKDESSSIEGNRELATKN